MGPALFNVYSTPLSKVIVDNSFKTKLAMLMIQILYLSFYTYTVTVIWSCLPWLQSLLKNARIAFSVNFEYYSVYDCIPSLMRDIQHWMNSNFLKMNQILIKLRSIYLNLKLFQNQVYKVVLLLVIIVFVLSNVLNILG